MARKKFDPEKATKAADKVIDVAEEVIEHRGLILRVLRALGKLLRVAR